MALCVPLKPLPPLGVKVGVATVSFVEVCVLLAAALPCTNAAGCGTMEALKRRPFHPYAASSDLSVESLLQPKGGTLFGDSLFNWRGLNGGLASPSACFVSYI